MNIIAAVDTNWAIGNRGGLLVSIPRDQKMFREMTMGKVIVYGRKTLNTFPQDQPLTGRTNIILSSKPGDFDTPELLAMKHYPFKGYQP